MEILDENKIKFQIYINKMKEGDILEGELIWELQKISRPQTDGPDLVKYESRFLPKQPE